MQFNQDITVNSTGTITFKGGYDALFTASSGMTTLQGVLSIATGKLVVANLTIL